MKRPWGFISSSRGRFRAGRQMNDDAVTMPALSGAGHAPAGIVREMLDELQIGTVFGFRLRAARLGFDAQYDLIVGRIAVLKREGDSAAARHASRELQRRMHDRDFKA